MEFKVGSYYIDNMPSIFIVISIEGENCIVREHHLLDVTEEAVTNDYRMDLLKNLNTKEITEVAAKKICKLKGVEWKF